MDRITSAGPKERVLILIPDYAEPLKCGMSIIRAFPKSRVCYITLYKSYGFLIKQFAKAGIKTENLFFIDCVSSFIEEPKKVKNCDFIDAPYNLDAISEAMQRCVRKGCNLFIFDSLSALVSYGMAISAGTSRLARFVRSFSEPFREQKFMVFFICRNKDKKQMVIEESLPIFDKVMRLRAV